MTPKSRRSSGPPGCVLDDDPITVRVFKGPSVLIPIGIERRNCRKAHSLHPVDRRLPFLDGGQVEDQKVILRRGSPNDMAVRFRKFEMIGCTLVSKHNAIETIMVCKPVQDI